MVSAECMPLFIIIRGKILDWTNQIVSHLCVEKSKEKSNSEVTWEDFRKSSHSLNAKSTDLR